ncbi:Plant invertase/pectin methylesterase inhibitor superfamily protein [Raphanus sativus]|nr:Plant invertase/pectin methylesterase inhibitor superfamily protein [Raphanus sativus]
MASTKDIDSICNSVGNKNFCQQTLTAYPPAVSATNIAKLVKATLDLGMTEAKKRAGFVAGLEKEPTFKKYFKMCNESYTSIVLNFRSARLEIEDNDSETASYDIAVSYDDTNIVKDTIGKNTDKASKSLMEMTLVMEDFINIAFVAVDKI